MVREERRGSQRFNLSWPISVLRGEQEVAHGKTSNISRGGAYFLSDAGAPLETGMTVAVRIGVPSGEESAASPDTITGEARVVRLEKDDAGCGIALHFGETVDPFRES